MEPKKKSEDNLRELNSVPRLGSECLCLLNHFVALILPLFSFFVALGIKPTTLTLQTYSHWTITLVLPIVRHRQKRLEG